MERYNYPAPEIQDRSFSNHQDFHPLHGKLQFPAIRLLIFPDLISIANKMPLEVEFSLRVSASLVQKEQRLIHQEMEQSISMKNTGKILWVIAVFFASAWAQTENVQVPAIQGVYIITYRSPAHVRSSSPEVFHAAASDIRKTLADKGVRIVQDRERGFIENESKMSTGNMTMLAKESGAGSLLFVTVDRPTTKWIKLVLRAYDLDGSLLWEENVDSGMSAMSGGSGYKKCFEKLEKVIAKRIGGPGLPADAGVNLLKENP